MGWFSCFQPRKPTPTTIVRCAISHPLEASRSTNNLRYPTSRVDEGLRKWKEANDRRMAEERRIHELEVQTYHQGRNQRRQIFGAELSPGHYDSNSQRQQREPSGKLNPRPKSGVEHYPPYYDARPQQNVACGVDQPKQISGAEISPRHYDSNSQRQQREPASKSRGRPNSGVEHYPPYYDAHPQQNVIAGVDQPKQISGVELSPGHYDSSSQPQQREPSSKSIGRPNSGVEHYPPYYDDRRRQNVVSGVDHYPAFEEIIEHERQAPRSIFERFDHSTDNPKCRPCSGVEHYAPMEVIDEHERPNPLALDSIYVMAFEQVEGRADSNAGRKVKHQHKPLEGRADSNAARSLTHTHKPDSHQGCQGDPWCSDGGLAKPGNPSSPTRQDERPRQKGPTEKTSQQASGRGSSTRRG